MLKHPSFSGLVDGGDLDSWAAWYGAHQSGVEGFYKALTAGHGSDHAALVGGAALRRESLEASLLVTVQQMEHFVLFNLLDKTPATATVDEWTQKRGIGGIPGSGAVGELADIPENTSDFKRKVGKVKFLKDRRRVSVEAEVQSQSGLADAIAEETDSGTLKLLTDAEYLMIYGDEDMQPNELDGLKKIMEAVGGDHVLDLGGNELSSDGSEFLDSAELIWRQGNWGRATDYFCSGPIQTDINRKLHPQFRVMQDGNQATVAKGAIVKRVTTQFGDIEAHPDPFIEESQPPFAVRGGEFAAQLAASGTSVVQSVAGVAAPHATSRFKAGQDGNYYYAVEAGRAEGRSALVKSAQVAVAVGDRVTLTITPPAGNNATYFAVYRGRQDGTNADNDFREVARVAADGDNPVTYLDANQNVPGCSDIFIVTNQKKAIGIRRLLPMTRFPLYPSTRAEYVWAQLFFLYLRVGKENQHRLIKNVRPSTASWKAFTN
jgi:hypothetical protein